MASWLKGFLIKGTLDLSGDDPEADIEDIEVGNVPGFMMAPVEAIVDRAVDEALKDLEIEHDYALELRDGEVEISNVAGSVSVGGRTYTGSGNLITISSLAFVGNLSIPGLTITISAITAEAVNLVRGLKIKQRPVEVLIGLYDPATKEIVDGLIPYFTGKIDDVRIKTPEAGGDSSIEIICESTSRALTIPRTDTRSDACHKRLFPTDDGFKYVGIQREKPIYFGMLDPKKAAKREKRRKARR